ncbi:MAG: hypothetical protein SFU83_13710 [Meiothermus sp.]|nr:hypothetical protein [Meiothermus sp.]
MTIRKKPWINLLVGVLFGPTFALITQDWSFQSGLLLSPMFWLLIATGIGISYWLWKDSNALLSPIGSDLLIGIGSAIGFCMFTGLGFAHKVNLHF